MTQEKEKFPHNPDYDRKDTNTASQITEFNDDVYVYGTLYADVFKVESKSTDPVA